MWALPSARGACPNRTQPHEAVGRGCSLAVFIHGCPWLDSAVCELGTALRRLRACGPVYLSSSLQVNALSWTSGRLMVRYYEKDVEVDDGTCPP